MSYGLVSGPTESASSQVRLYIEDPVRFWESCIQQYGPVIRLDLGSLGPVVLFAEPESVKSIFRLPASAFECAPYNEHYRYVMGDLSLLLQDGEIHRRQRRLLSPLLRHDQWLPQGAAISEIVRPMVENWPEGEAFNPRPSLHEATFQVMIRLIFGELESKTSRELIAVHRESVATQAGSWGPWRRFAAMQPRIRRLLASEISERRANPELPGFLTHLARAQDEAGEALSDAECEDHVFSLLVAGVDTSAISLAWALHWLSREPGPLERLLTELPAAAGDESGWTLFRLPYLEAVYSETLRMYPIVPTPSGRKLKRETQIGEHSFEAGVTLAPCTYLVHRCENIYPQSARFRPERFLERTFGPFEYFPFGGGVRSCVGEMLAAMEFKSALRTILELWEIQPTAAPAMHPVRHGTLLAPPDESTMVVRRR
jgi:cytochrome P450